MSRKAASRRCKIVPSLHPADGHNVFELPAGRQHWLAALDPFLRARQLPTWSPQQVKAVAQRLQDLADTAIGWSSLFLGLHAESPGAGPERRAEYSAATAGLEQAQKGALASCEKAAKMPCRVIMQNFNVVGP